MVLGPPCDGDSDRARGSVRASDHEPLSGAHHEAHHLPGRGRSTRGHLGTGRLGSQRRPPPATPRRPTFAPPPATRPTTRPATSATTATTATTAQTTASVITAPRRLES